MKILGITGTIGAGKGAAVEYLKSKGFGHFSAREFIYEEVRKRGLPFVRDSLHSVANDLRAKHGPTYVIRSLYERAAATGKDCVIESVRAVAEADLIKGRPDSMLLAIDADRRVRYERIRARRLETDNVSFDKFVEDEEKEMASADPFGMNIAECMRCADIVIQNDGTLDDLHRKLDSALGIGPTR